MRTTKMKASLIIKEVQQALRDEATKDGLKSQQMFHKTPIKALGLRNPHVHKIAKTFFKKIQHLSKKEILDAAEELLKSGYHEERLVAFDWAQYVPVEKEDFQRFKRWTEEYVDNWAQCDGFVPYVLEKFLHYPDLKKEMFKWTTHTKTMVRRAAAVAYLHDGGGSKPSTHNIEDRFKIALALMHDKEDLVQKAYGWLLKNASKTHRTEVYNFVMKHKHDMPRTALRYAIEYYTKEEKKQLMA